MKGHQPITFSSNQRYREKEFPCGMLSHFMINRWFSLCTAKKEWGQ
ncbi:hypothetical protein [Azospirillum argentinense]